MKRLLESFFLFLDQFDTPEASVTFDMDRRYIDSWGERVWINTLRTDVNIPSNFLPLFDMIINKYGDEIWEGSQSEDEYDEYYYRLTISFKVDPRVMIMTSMITENGEEPAGDSYELNDNEEVNTFLDEHNLDYIVIKYDGGGDSGEIKNVGEGNDNDVYDLSAGMEDVIYTYLERSFGGWENNEGASGEIKVTKEEIEINHIWNTRDQVKSDLRLMVELKNVK